MVELEERGAVALVTLNRPERRNALDAEACGELARAVADATAGGTRVMVLHGAGTNFCAGADLTGVEDREFADRLRVALHALRDAPFPVVAAVHGAALGAGTQLAVACDLRVAAPDARFGIPAAKLGLMVDHWTVQRVVALAGNGPARAMLLAAEEIPAERALALGLVDRAGSLEDALAWADRIATLAPLTIQGHKIALNSLEPAVGDDPEVSAAFLRAWQSDDMVEGMTAFRERRPPRFEGR